MATIRVYRRQKGLVYRVEIRRRGQYLARNFDRKSTAQRWAEDTEGMLAAGGFVGEAPAGDMGVRAALDRYSMEVSRYKRPNSRARDETSAKRLLHSLDGLTMGEVTPAVVAQYRDLRLKEVGASTIHKELALLSHLFNVAAREWSLDLANPVRRVRKPPLPHGRLRVLNQAEIDRLLATCQANRQGKLHCFVIVMLHTAMRPSEAAGLRWAAVDLASRMVELVQTKTTPRRVALAWPAVEALAGLRKSAAGDYVFLPAATAEVGRQRPANYFKRSFRSAVATAGIEDFHMHDLRHTAASYLLMHGADLRTLADILGHSTMQMVQRYTHLLDDHKLAAVDRLAIVNPGGL